MSAEALYTDWRLVRARAAVQAHDSFDFKAYAEEFGLDVEETLEIFDLAARELGIRIVIQFEDGTVPVTH
jgi:hypothetical protein